MDGQPIRTFLDSGVLIAAYKGSPSIEASAIDILDDPNRVFLSSPFVRHEVSPKALYNRCTLGWLRTISGSVACSAIGHTAYNVAVVGFTGY